MLVVLLIIQLIILSIILEYVIVWWLCQSYCELDGGDSADSTYDGCDDDDAEVDGGTDSSVDDNAFPPQGPYQPVP